MSYDVSHLTIDSAFAAIVHAPYDVT